MGHQRPIHAPAGRPSADVPDEEESRALRRAGPEDPRRRAAGQVPSPHDRAERPRAGPSARRSRTASWARSRRRCRGHGPPLRRRHGSPGQRLSGARRLGAGPPRRRRLAGHAARRAPPPPTRRHAHRSCWCRPPTSASWSRTAREDEPRELREAGVAPPRSPSSCRRPSARSSPGRRRPAGRARRARRDSCGPPTTGPRTAGSTPRCWPSSSGCGPRPPRCSRARAGVDADRHLLPTRMRGPAPPSGRRRPTARLADTSACFGGRQRLDGRRSACRGRRR